MTIQFENVIPDPLREIASKDALIWNKKFVFNSNEKYQISARSGVGKTTLLSIIYGIRRDYSGSILLNDLIIKNLSTRQWSDLRKTKISMVFQGLQLFDNMTVMENLLIKNRLTNFFQETEIIRMLQQLEVENLMQKKVGIISYGQKQRVAIIRALCQPFHLIMLDEPFSHLDVETTKSALHLIHNRALEDNATLIITSLSDVSLSDDFKLLKL